jgi:hypothetical protein
LLCTPKLTLTGGTLQVREYKWAPDPIMAVNPLTANLDPMMQPASVGQFALYHYGPWRENGAAPNDDDDDDEEIVPLDDETKQKATQAFSGADAEMSDEELQEIFNSIDVDGGGTLDKGELFSALKAMSMPSREIYELLNSITEDELDFDGFKDMVRKRNAERSS